MNDIHSFTNHRLSVRAYRLSAHRHMLKLPARLPLVLVRVILEPGGQLVYKPLVARNAELVLTLFDPLSVHTPELCRSHHSSMPFAP